MWDKFNCKLLNESDKLDQRESHLLKLTCKRTYDGYRLISDEYKKFTDKTNKYEQSDELVFVFPLCKSPYELQYEEFRFSIIDKNSYKVKQFSEKKFTYTKVPFMCF